MRNVTMENRKSTPRSNAPAEEAVRTQGRGPTPSSASEPVREENPESESFVADSRFFMSPAQVVDGRLAALTKGSSILVSQLNRPARPRYQ